MIEAILFAGWISAVAIYLYSTALFSAYRLTRSRFPAFAQRCANLFVPVFNVIIQQISVPAQFGSNPGSGMSTHYGK